MHFIIAIVGASGSGKTTISRAMAEAGIPDIVSYTTRPMRPGETQGVEHRFITAEEAVHLLETKAIAAYTEFGGYTYFTTIEQLSEHKYCTYVIDERGLEFLQTAVSEQDFKIIPVFVRRNADDIRQTIDADRISRDEERSWFCQGGYDIVIENDAPDAHRLAEWAFRFALSLLAVLPVRHSVHRCELQTSDPRIITIVNNINNVRSAL